MIIILFYSFVREFAACIAQPEASVCLALTQRQNTLNIYREGFLTRFSLGGWWAGWREGGGGKYGRPESANKRSACLKVSTVSVDVKHHVYLKVSGSCFLLLGPNEGNTNSHCITLNP